MLLNFRFNPATTNNLIGRTFWLLTLTASLALAVGLSACATSEPGIRTVQPVWEIPTYPRLHSIVRRGAVDKKDNSVYLATPAALFRIHNSQVQALSEPPVKGAQLILAPGGAIYAWLIPVPKSQGLFSVRLMSLSNDLLAELLPEEQPPLGFATTFIGFQGKLLVTVSPLDDHEGLGGRFRYTFWDRHGKVRKSIVLNAFHSGVVDAKGTVILLLGPEEAAAYSADGTRIWHLPGRFRQAAVSTDGRFALLNPAERKAIDRVVIFDGKKSVEVTVPTPVHHLRIAPDTSFALVVGDRGRYFHLNPASGQLIEGTPLPFEGFYTISDAELLDQNTIALGVLHRSGKPPGHSWPQGSVVVLDREGNIKFMKKWKIREPIAFLPALDVTYHDRYLIGFTEDDALLLDLQR